MKPDNRSATHFVDAVVSRAKFDREIQQFRAMESEYHRRGWIMRDVEFPCVTVLMAAAHLTPAPVLFAVRIDFTNYDFWPLSVVFLHPFTLVPLTVNEMLTRFPKAPSVANRDPRIEGNAEAAASLPTDLLQAHADMKPFLCCQGFREYHHHPQHSNDPWLAYRGNGIGTLYYVLDTLYRHGVVPLQWRIDLVSAQFQMSFQPDPARISP
jgi:hypothetical protein